MTSQGRNKSVSIDSSTAMFSHDAACVEGSKARTYLVVPSGALRVRPYSYLKIAAWRSVICFSIHAHDAMLTLKCT
jgi:hypothetical protein